MKARRRKTDETEVGRVSLDTVISEGRTVVFNLLAAIDHYEKSKANPAEGDEDK